MDKRRKTRNLRAASGGQAIVLVTLALFAMAGLMGLAVDLGWSFYLKKQAQSSADAAALSAVQEAKNRLVGTSMSTFSCPDGTNNTVAHVDCRPLTNCSAVLDGGAD